LDTLLLAAGSFIAVELMPVAEFSGDFSWGYNPAHPFAVENDYGGPDALKRFVNFQSGLSGVWETSSDMHDLPDRDTQDVRAAEAVALFCYQVKKWIGAFAAALGGLDTLVFASGIGEKAPAVRARICDGLGSLGIEFEERRNAANGGVISTNGGRVVVRVMPTDEDMDDREYGLLRFGSYN
jgi:acetate kinase